MPEILECYPAIRSIYGYIRRVSGYKNTKKSEHCSARLSRHFI